MANLIQVQAPMELPVTLKQVKDFMRVDTDDSDDMIWGLINAAVAYFDGPEGILGRALMPQSWVLWLPEWPASEIIELPLGPVIEVTGITYLDSAAALQTLAATQYTTLDNETITISPTGSWPAVYANREDAIRIAFEAGYRNDTSPEQIGVPEGVRQAIIAIVQHMYDGGEGIPDVAYTLVAPLRVRRLGYA